MKSLVSIVHIVAEGILEDAALAYPPLGRELVRDRASLRSLVATRGLGVFLLDLPALDAVLTDTLESGRLVTGKPLTKVVSQRVRVPKLFRGLWLRVVDNSGSLRLDPDPTAIDFLRQIFCLGKKIEVPCSQPRIEEAINEFVQIERSIRRPTLDWEGDACFDGSLAKLNRFASLCHITTDPALFEDDLGGVCHEDSHLLERLDTICRDVSTRFGLFDPVDYENSRLAKGLPSGTKNGPGAVSDRSSKQEKFYFGVWPEKLQSVFAYDFFGDYRRVGPSEHSTNEHPSKLICVPKTAKGPRLIAAEPSYHQWCQQLVRAFLEEKIPDVFQGKVISLRDQSRSHPLVMTGSQDRSVATVDLSSASDRLSCWAIERAFAANLSLLDAFRACRTRVIGPSRGVDIDHALLRKFSTMGSALTFPVQSIFYACVALASCPGNGRLDYHLNRWGNQIRVYGDDIIVPKTGLAGLKRLLHILGLKVNENKTFSNAFFRESCGLDAFRGYDVTPVKPRHLDPTTPVGRLSLIELSNNLFLKGMWRAAERVTALLPGTTLRSLPVVRPDTGTLGRVSFSGEDWQHLKSRWNHHLHRWEALCTSYTSKTEDTFTEGTDYTMQSLHRLHSRRLESTSQAMPARLGRVTKAVTRERRSWEASNQNSVPHMRAANVS